MKKSTYIAVILGIGAVLVSGYFYVKGFSGGIKKNSIIPVQNEQKEVLSAKFNFGSGENDFGLELSPITESIGGNRGPAAIAQDASGNIYISDRINNRIKVFGPDFEQKLIYKTDKPLEGIAADSDGNIYGYGGGPGPILFLYKYDVHGKMLNKVKIFDNASGNDPPEYRYRFGVMMLRENKLYTIDPVFLKSYLIGETGDNFIVYPISEAKSLDGVYGASGRIYDARGGALQPSGILQTREFLGEDASGSAYILIYSKSPDEKVLQYLVYKYDRANESAEQFTINGKALILSATSANFSLNASGDMVGFFIEKDGLTLRKWSVRHQ